MAAGGVFRIIANDGQADRMILATGLLNQRIKDIECARKAAGYADYTPTLMDLEQTHLIFMNAHFKPFAAVGFEYNKTRPQTGTSTLGNPLSFSIPQFGDFFHDIVGRQQLSAFNSSLQNVPVQGVDPQFPADATDWDGAVFANTWYSMVDPFGNTVLPGAQFRNLVRYAEYPGERLYQRVKFDVNGNPLDEYNDTTTVMLRKFTVGADKITGYKRLVGQEVKMEGFGGVKTTYAHDLHNDGVVAPTTVDGVGMATIPQQAAVPTFTTPANHLNPHFPDNAHNVNLPNTAGQPHLNVQRRCISAVDGPQTPKYQQPAMEIWNQLNFWFCKDVRLAVASVSVPFGQRFIQVDLADQNRLAFEFPGLYIKQVTEVANPGGGGLVTSATGAARTVMYRAYINAGTMTQIALSHVELYINNIFVNPEVHDIYIKRIGFSLIRVFRYHRTLSNSDGRDEKLLNQLKWPIEVLYIGLRPTFNTDAANPNQHRDWHRMTKTLDLIGDLHDIAEVPQLGHGAGALAAVPESISRQGQIIPDTWVKETPSLQSATVTAHGVSLYDDFRNIFFSSYSPYHYGGTNIVTPDDAGAMMVNFCFYPGSYQPSGHMNVSRAREFYFSWNTNYVTANTPADLTVTARAINFLLITDGSAVLRYST